MYMDLYLMINDKSIENYKFNLFNYNKKKPKTIHKNTSTDNFMKFQWPWLL